MQEFNTVIIGGGIVGSGIFRDLSLHNIPTLLIDKNDFAARTSQSSSKMLHGGIRYLENLDFQLVFEALHEKNLWLQIAPHLCFEEKFYLPVFEDSKRPLWMIKCGLFLYDLLSGLQNSPHELKNSSEVRSDIKIINTKNLSGAGVYCDAIVDDARMNLELIYDALSNSLCQARNYHKLLSDIVSGNYHILTIEDLEKKTIYQVRTRNIVYACGPFTDNFLNELTKNEKQFVWKNFLIPSKGSHLWFSKKDLPLNHPVVMTPKDENEDRVIFVIPQNELVLVGTTEIKTNEDYDHLKISDSETEYLLKNLNHYFPSVNLATQNIVGRFSGIRPLVRDGESDNLGKTSREHRIVQPLHNSFVIAGGKYTTFRVMGQEITRNIVTRANKSYNRDLSKTPFRKTSTINSFNFKIPSNLELIKILEEEMPKNLEDLVSRRLGIATKKIWELKAKCEFDPFFIERLDLINKYFPITIDQIKQFSEN